MRRPAPWVDQATCDVIETVVVSPDTVFAEALSVCLTREEGIEVVGLARDTESAERAVVELEPALLLSDQRAVDPGFLARLADLRAQHDTLRLVLVTTTARGTRAEQALFDAVVPPHSSLELVIATVREAARHPARRAVLEPRDDLGLSERELEVLRLLAADVGTSGIASRLHLSQHTVRNHVRRLTAKLGVSSRRHAVSEGRRLGLI